MIEILALNLYGILKCHQSTFQSLKFGGRTYVSYVLLVGIRMKAYIF